MTASIDIPAGTLDEWLNELKPYQRDAFHELIKTMTPERAAEHWVSTQGSGNVLGFGGIPKPKPFWDAFKAEFRRFICDDTAYVEEKRSLIGQGPIARAILISYVSATIGASIGQPAALLAPAATVLLYIAGQMGRNAFCSTDPKSPSAG